MLIGTVLVILLQASGAPAAPPAGETPPAPIAVPAGMMDCEYNRSTHTRMCTTAEGEVLRCRRERIVGSRLPTMLCLSHREDQQIQDESRDALDRQQHISTPG